MTGNPPLSSGWLQLKTTLSHVGSPVKSLGLLGAAVEYEQSKRFKTCIFFFLIERRFACSFDRLVS